MSFLPRLIRIFLLAVYAFFTGFQFPIVRALGRRISRPWLRSRFGVTALQAELAGVIFFLLFDPPALLSRSFLMCWMGALAMTLPLFIRRFPNLDRALKAYILLWPFCFASPVSLFWNILLAPWIGFLLFPAVLLSFMFHSLVPLSDFLWWGFLSLLRLGPDGSPWPLAIAPQYLFWLPPALHLMFLYLEVRWRRAHAFSLSPT